MNVGGYYGNNIDYTISNGYPPFSVELKNSGLAINTHNEFGTYSFTGITAGTYVLNVIDDKNCEYSANIIISGHPVPVVSVLKFINVSVVDVVDIITCNLSVTISSPSPNIIELSNFVSSDPENANYKIEIFKNTETVLSTTFNGGTSYVADGLAFGDYSVVVTDLTANDCSITQATTVSGIGFNDTVKCVVPTNNGTGYLFGGMFRKYGNITTNNITKLDLAFEYDDDFNSGSGILTDGYGVNGLTPYGESYFMFGDSQTYNDKTNPNAIFKLHENGSVNETGFTTTQIIDGPVRFIKTIDRTFIGGSFSSGSLIATDGNGVTLFDFSIGNGFRTADGSGLGTTLDCYSFNGSEILIGGSFYQFSGITSPGLVLLDVYGNLLSTGSITNSLNGSVTSMCEARSGGGVFIFGSFSSFNGVNVYSLFKMDSDYSINPNFTVANGIFTNSNTYKVYATSDGGCFADGFKFNADGSVDNHFHPNKFNDQIYDYLETDEGKYIIVGAFTTFNEQSTNRCIVLNQDGTVFKLFA